MQRCQLVSYGPDATAALAQLICEAQAGDALAPVTVVVPSNLAGLSLRRTLARSQGLLNVRFLVLARLTELLGAPSLAAEGRSPLTRWRRYEAIRGALGYDAGVLAPVADHPSTLRALDNAFRELRYAAPEALRRTSASRGRQGDVARLYRRFRETTSDCYDEADLADAARDAFTVGTAGLHDIGRVVIFLPGPLTPPAAAFARALLDAGRATLIAGVTGDPSADAGVLALMSPAPRPPLPLGQMASSAGPDGQADPLPSTPATTLPAATHIAVAADAEEEARMAIRMAMHAARGEHLPLNRIAILFPASGGYAELLHEQLESAGIPHNGPPTAMLAGSIAGRALLGLLALGDGELSRERVFEWLASAPILEAREGPHAGRPVPSRRWEQVARDAGVVRGIGQWRSRLRALMSQREMEAQVADAEGEEWRANARRRDIDDAERLLTFVEEIAGYLTVRIASPRLALLRAASLLERYLGTGQLHDKWPPDEADAFERVHELLLEAAASSPGSEGGFGLAESRRALQWLLDQPGARLGPFGQGIFIAPVKLAAGMEFDRVFVLGLVEGQLPTPGSTDPLLPDDEREALGLPPASDDQRRAYLAALASAPHRRLIVPRADLRNGRKQLPSRWLLESAARLAGKSLTATEFEKLRPSSWLTVAASFPSALENACEPATAQEFDLRLLLDGPRNALRNPLLCLPEFTSVVDGIQASRARGLRPRGNPALSHWDGSIGPVASPASPGARPVSPTALELMAKCPFSYFLRHQLGVREIEEPEEALEITGRDRGALMHRILERFFTEAARDGELPVGDDPWDAAGHARMVAIALEECNRDEARGITGSRLLWKLERRRLLDALDTFLDADNRQRAQGFTFSQAELEFGGDQQASLTLADGRVVHFRGRIDRVDRAQDGRIIVYDYKTGSDKDFNKLSGPEPFAAGQHLQLAVYALALGAAGKTNAPVSAYYWFLGRNTGLHGYTLDSAHLAQFTRVVDDLDTTIAGGLFPANPGKDAENCRYCKFERVCLPKKRRSQHLAQRIETPGLERYAALANLATVLGKDDTDD